MPATTDACYPEGFAEDVRLGELIKDAGEAHVTTVDKRKNQKAVAASKWGGNRGPLQHALDITDVDAELLRDAISAVLLEGDAFLIGLTSDQGAIATRVLSEAGKEVWYDATTEAFESTLRALRDISKTL